MEVFLCNDIREYDEKEYGFMLIPCNFIPAQLAYKKSKEHQEGKCPVCGAKIYADPSGWCGHL